MSQSHLRGLAYVLVAGSLWGLGGTAAQLLFQRHGIQPQWLVSVRLGAAGLILLLVVRPRWPRRQWPRLVLFAVLGVAAVQYCYFAAIAASNVATATFLQYTSVAMISGWEIARGRAPLTPLRGLALAASLGGVTLLALGGPAGVGQLRLNPVGVVFGLLSAVTAAYYTLSSVPLVRSLGAWPTTTWGFALGALPMLIWTPPWVVRPTGSGVEVAALVAFVVLFGTLVAFGLYLASLRHISAGEAAITATSEPVATAIVALLVLGVALRPLQYLGGAAIVGAVLLLRRPPPRARPEMPLPEPPG